MFEAAVFAHDIDFEGPVVVLMWPSRAVPSVRGYRQDELGVACAISAFTAVVSSLGNRCPNAEIQLVANSHGCRLSVPAILSASMTRSKEEGPLIDELVLAAPDRDAGAFDAMVGPHIERISRRTTIYFSRKDRALGFCAKLHPEGTRLGLDGLTSTRATVVDVSNVEDHDVLGFGHQLHRTSPDVLADIEQVVAGNTEGVRRLARVLAKGQAKRWSLDTSPRPEALAASD